MTSKINSFTIEHIDRITISNCGNLISIKENKNYLEFDIKSLSSVKAINDIREFQYGNVDKTSYIDIFYYEKKTNLEYPIMRGCSPGYY